MDLLGVKAKTYDNFCRTSLGHFIDVVEHQISGLRIIVLKPT